MLPYKVVAVTGASGFIGRKLVAELVLRGINVRPILRSESSTSCISEIMPKSCKIVDIGPTTMWSDILTNVECVIHCAAFAHVNKADNPDIIRTLNKVNIEGSKRLAEQAADLGVKRFIFISSIGVNGISTRISSAFKPYDTSEPTEAYSISKFEAENAIRVVSKKSGMQLVIIRPPLVYGYGAKGNLARLLNMVYSGMPIPFGSIKNKKSFIGIDNLIDLIILCIDHPKAPGQTLLASDNQDISIADFIIQIYSAMNRSPRLYKIPLPLLQLAAYVAGKTKDLDRLGQSLTVDCGQTCELLEWKPPFTLKEGIERMIKIK